MKTLTIFLIILSSSVFGQTNYNTVLNTKGDSVDTKINLRLEKSRKLDNLAHLMFAASVVSTIIIYHTPNKHISPFIIPASLAIGGMGVKVWADHYDE
jgi:hypothetical protein